MMQPPSKQFNVRVYGIFIHDGRLLVNEEIIRGKQIIKLPGGGLDHGESTIDCLRREWMEELGMTIEVGRHFYTTDFFQASAYDNSQVISIYYLVSAPMPQAIINHVTNERTYWMDIAQVSEDTFTLPIDRRVGELLRQYFAENSGSR